MALIETPRSSMPEPRDLTPTDITTKTVTERAQIHQEEIRELLEEGTIGRGISAILTTPPIEGGSSTIKPSTDETQQQNDKVPLDYLVSIHSTPENQEPMPKIDPEILKTIEHVNVANRIGRPVSRILPDGRTIVTKPSKIA